MKLVPNYNPIAHIFCNILLLLSSSLISDHLRVSSLGINYGQVANDLPPPQKVATLLKSLNVTNKVRIYDTNPQVLTSFANTNIELIVTVENDLLPSLSSSPQQALQWVTSNIRPYFPATRITGIAVGNEIFTDPDTSLTAHVVPAMSNIHSALVQLGLSPYIQVSSPTSLAVLAVSYPPSAGAFRPELTAVMTQFLNFLHTANSPFWINAYPYFAYKDDPTRIPLDYVLFNQNRGTVDPYTGLNYDNMLYAQVDSAVFAAQKMGFGGVDVRVSETGWPSKGDNDEVGATVQNAAVYNRNLLRRQIANEGTPLRPNSKLDVYLFALFNEDMKPGPTSERNYGLFHPDCTMAYNVGISSLAASTSTANGYAAASTYNSTSSSTSSASVSFASSGSKAANIGYCQSLVYWTFVYLLFLFKFLQEDQRQQRPPHPR